MQAVQGDEEGKGGAGMKLLHEMRDLLEYHGRIDGAAGDLWSWLPSHAQSKKRYGNGHYNRDAEVEEVLREATKVLSFLAGYGDENKLTKDEQEWAMARFGPRRNDPHKKHDAWEAELPPEEAE